MESIPEDGTEEGQFFHREHNLFSAWDDTRPGPDCQEADDELETNVINLVMAANERMFSSKR